VNYLLDTHSWIWWHLNPQKLSKKASETIQQASRGGGLLLSAISPWEFCKLLEKDRLKISLAGNDWMQAAFDALPVRLVPISPEISWQSTTLPAPFHDDPADQIIVATARIEQSTLISCDKLIQNYLHVKTVW